MLGRSLLLVPVAALAWLSSEASGQFLGRVSESNDQQAAGAALPPDFRGRLTYQGNFSGRRTEPGRAPRRLDLRSIASSGGRTIEFAGPATIEIEYEGSVVRATYTADGRRGGFTGTRRGSDCRVIDTGDGGVGTFRCDRNGFTGTFESAPGARAIYRTTVETHATRFVDAAEEERRTASIATEAAQRQAAQRREDSAASVPSQRRTPISTEANREPEQQTGSSEVAAEALMAGGRVRMSGPLARQIDQIIRFDSQSWLLLGYQPNSVTAVQTRRLGSQGDFYVRANFRYRGGSTGWAGLLVEGGNFICVEYPDTYGTCRRIGGGFRARLAEEFTPRQQSLLEMLQEDSARCARARTEGRLVAC